MSESRSPTDQTTSTRQPSQPPKTFKPRAGIQRKTKAEREQFAKQEAERQQARLAENDKRTGSPASGGRGGKAARGRGDASMSRDERAKGVLSAGGVFGASTGLKTDSRSRGALGVGSGYSERLEGDNTKPTDHDRPEGSGLTDVALSTSKGGNRTTTGRNGDGIEISSDDELDIPKRDIERIWISSDEDDQDSLKGKSRVSYQPQKPPYSLRPLRAPRILEQEEHNSSGLVARVDKAAKKGSDQDVHELEGDIMDLDESGITKQAPSSPELKKKALKKFSSRSRDAKANVGTVEERAERLRLQEDIQKLRTEFNAKVYGKSAVGSNSSATEKIDSTGENELDNKLLLFQFPPLIPFLRDPQLATDSVEIKGEEEVVEQVNTTNTQAPTAPEIKKEAEEPRLIKPGVPTSGVLTADSTDRLPPGYVGKLRVHASGKVSLDWGGIDMEVRYGSEVDFLQDAVLVETRNQTDEKGTTYALGQVNKKMVVIPDWAKLYD